MESTPPRERRAERLRRASDFRQKKAGSERLLNAIEQKDALNAAQEELARLRAEIERLKRP